MTHHRTPNVTREQIAQVMDDFYEQVQQHPELSPAFQVVEDWPQHKTKLTHYWWMALGGEPTPTTLGKNIDKRATHLNY